MRRLSWIDRILTEVNLGLDSVFISPDALPQEESPSKKMSLQQNLSSEDRRHASGLIRVDHTGEICAQALYRGQAFLARKVETKNALWNAAIEEHNHLIWCRERLHELGAHPSYLNGLWYTASFLIGLVAASLGDDWSNGFVVETERQVEAHLGRHLAELPLQDERSRAILVKMQEEEKDHAYAADKRGAKDLPLWVKRLMSLKSQVMTRTAYWV